MSGDPGEFEIIQQFFAPLTKGHEAALGLTDDAALIPPFGSGQMVATKDMMIAGVHFFPEDPPELIAKKLLRVNLSDLASMGATPYGYLLGCAFPSDVGPEWLKSFSRGLAEDQSRFGIGLLGGDTVSTSGPLSLSLTALGQVDGAPLRRDGAQPGDLLMVSGTIGDAALGLQVARGELSCAAQDDLLQRLRCPTPRVTLGHAALGLAHAGLDISDGLAADLAHMCRASGCGAVLDQAAIPLSEAVRGVVESDPRQWAAVLGGGDDYELLLAVPPEALKLLQDKAAALSVLLSQIGRILPGSERFLRTSEGEEKPLEEAGFRHF